MTHLPLPSPDPAAALRALMAELCALAGGSVIARMLATLLALLAQAAQRPEIARPGLRPATSPAITSDTLDHSEDEYAWIMVPAPWRSGQGWNLCPHPLSLPCAPTGPEVPIFQIAPA